ncbi:MAG TPA: FAD-dependent oxidoreductase [Dehalococcoidia bacterium]|nr:FAD-dependent oxidoreductase [Dehalococcoidia bacterium]
MVNHRTVFVWRGTGSISRGADTIYEAFKVEVERQGLTNAEVEFTGCDDFCTEAPNVLVEPDGILYTHVETEDVAEIVSSHLRDDKPVERLFYRDPVTGQAVPLYSDINFYKKQQRIILQNIVHINPEKIDHYIANGGYQALEKALVKMTPEEVIEEIKRSGLRGRGGAGFPTGRKWEGCRRAVGTPKYVICNGDEGDPGAFMDRSILEADPHAVIEGLTIAGYAVGTSKGYIYVRAEYPLAVERLRIAIFQAIQHGFLGKNIFGSDFSFDIEIREGAGAFVCGESTALMRSIEGKRGMPRQTPPRSVEKGLDGKPTVLNNVKTFAYVPQIISKGADWFSSLGTEKNEGTAVFALTGKIAISGLVEVPMGTSIASIIFDIGGGIPRGKQFKAVQTGGPSGGCIPTQFMDVPVEFDSLAKLGSIMGSGGMVVMDNSTCMVEIARYFLSFTQAESCGKCIPCRLGTKQMLEILTRITQGKGRDEDIDTLITIAKVVQECSLCGLGQSCPNPVLTTLKYFLGEYETHIKEKKCPGAVCDALMISPCQHTCPAGINIPKYVAHIAAGEYLDAIETIRERNPFPSICGRICHHPCEGRCRRGELDESVAIRPLKRFAADWYFDHAGELPPPEPFPQTQSQRVAVVGAGPTGLSCAYFLAQAGYPVTVFEALPLGGGMLSVAVPAFRLPGEVIQREIDYIAKKGVEIKYNTPINTNYTIDHLKREGFDAVFIAAGAQRSQRVGIPGEVEGIEGLYYGLQFLRDVKIGRPINIGRRVAVIGAGNVALDVCLTVVRLGAEEVNAYEMMAREQVLVTDADYEEAVAEGIKVNFLTSPVRMVSDNWRVTGLQCIRRRLGEMDESGRRRSVPIYGSEFFVEADTVIVSIGQAPDLSFLPADSALERTRWERLAVDSNTLSTNVPGVFAGGDFVFGPGFIIDAVAAGRRVAIAIDKYLRDDTSRVEMYDLRQRGNGEKGGQEGEESWEIQPRLEMPKLLAQERKTTFEEIERGFSEEVARQEARRCLRCDLET